MNPADHTKTLTTDERMLLGLPVSALAAPEAAAHILDRAQAHAGGYVCVVNVHMLMTARDDPQFRAVYLGAAMRLPDSAVVRKAAAWRAREPAPSTLLGSRLTLALCEGAARRAIPVALIGGAPETLDRLREALPAAAPGLVIATSLSPPFRELSDEDVNAIATQVREAGARLAFVALGCPKQERLMARLAPHLPATVLIGVGAAFETLAGVRPPSPEWVHAAGLEWAYRLMLEPRRLWRRYLSTNPRFIAAFVHELVTGRPPALRS